MAVIIYHAHSVSTDLSAILPEISQRKFFLAQNKWQKLFGRGFLSSKEWCCLKTLQEPSVFLFYPNMHMQATYIAGFRVRSYVNALLKECMYLTWRSDLAMFDLRLASTFNSGIWTQFPTCTTYSNKTNTGNTFLALTTTKNNAAL